MISPGWMALMLALLHATTCTEALLLLWMMSRISFGSFKSGLICKTQKVPHVIIKMMQLFQSSEPVAAL